MIFKTFFFSFVISTSHRCQVFGSFSCSCFENSHMNVVSVRPGRKQTRTAAQLTYFNLLMQLPLVFIILSFSFCFLMFFFFFIPFPFWLSPTSVQFYCLVLTSDSRRWTQKKGSVGLCVQIDQKSGNTVQLTMLFILFFSFQTCCSQE